MLSVMPEGTPTLMDPVELSYLVEELNGTGAVLIQVPFDQPDDCSEDPEDDGPLPSILLIEFDRYHRVYTEPVCGRSCATQKIHALLDSKTRPGDIRVHVLSAP